ncbi:MAG: hypothetical protein KAJ19_28400 [Gammaproteobacteria bacterium]|nr:hypothetical protein [Gammaproteobacteria bacterium]
MKRTIAIALALVTITAGCGAVRNLLHMGASTLLECYDAEGEPVYAEGDTSAEAAKCFEVYGEGE